MAIKYTPPRGAILVCDFHDTVSPEICKKRPVMVLSCVSPFLCIVVPFSTKEPNPVKPWHLKLSMKELMPSPYDSPYQWVKCDLIMTVSFKRLSPLLKGRDKTGKRIYDHRVAPAAVYNAVAKRVQNVLFPWKSPDIQIDSP